MGMDILARGLAINALEKIKNISPQEWDLSTLVSKEELAALRSNLLVDELGDFSIKLTIDSEISFLEFFKVLPKCGLYTLYLEAGREDNPDPTLSYQGFCHLAQGAETNSEPYGWALIFDETGNAYILHIRGNLTSSWVKIGNSIVTENFVTKDNLNESIIEVLQNQIGFAEDGEY